ncbi:outer membrane lipoprotein [Vibrio mangrovi]|uniref:Glycine zipper 2TM domain-containing protein n=1 Tax=Vibrio mangrovi TaxID=474394 RepID=A0A1Y6IPC6_9VIBR|nr:glycine zipper 2TM domain-containing protein [Vibrio mangrovi]MDW6004280.1 glycine zipper 2TM domain-containing protein [Vibrio mangrovi]SMR98921.1 hypothetical protein VIM7927_00136 [Vibrio mangrovi]
MRLLTLILFVFPMIANAAYDRNVARPVDQVVFGQIDSVRYFSQTEVIHARENGWETFIGAVAGGIIGHQFGGGRGKPLATIVGSIAGAGIARHHAVRSYQRDDQLVELLIKTEGDKYIDVIQDADPNMIFSREDRVRILYFNDGVRVDKEY